MWLLLLVLMETAAADATPGNPMALLLLPPLLVLPLLVLVRVRVRVRVLVLVAASSTLFHALPCAPITHNNIKQQRCEQGQVLSHAVGSKKTVAKR